MLAFVLMFYCAGVCVAVINGVNYDCEIGRACSTYGGEKSHVEDFGGETWGKETTCKTQA